MRSGDGLNTSQQSQLDQLEAQEQQLYGSKPPPPIPPGGEDASNTNTTTVNAQDPNALYGPSGYGAANYLSITGRAYSYRVTFENDAAATAPAQRVKVSNYLDPGFDWSSFQLIGIGFGDNQLVIPAANQHYQTTVSMIYNGETFDVQLEAGIHGDTGEVYAVFQSITPNTSLPPANVLTGFLPPEDGTGRGQGYLAYTVAPKPGLATGTEIRNVASIIFDANDPITTNQVNPHDPSQGTDPTKEALITIRFFRSIPTILPVCGSSEIPWPGKGAGRVSR